MYSLFLEFNIHGVRFCTGRYAIFSARPRNTQYKNTKLFYYIKILFRTTGANVDIFILFFFLFDDVLLLQIVRESERDHNLHNRVDREQNGEILDFANPILYGQFPLFFDSCAVSYEKIQAVKYQPNTHPRAGCVFAIYNRNN